MSRRFTSLPSVAPTISPRALTASTISGSGLFQTDAGSSPTSAPKPTADIGCDFENTSASGPMPTSRYWDHALRRCSSSFSRIAASEPGRIFDRSAPITLLIVSRTARAFAGSPPACSSITRSTRLTANVTPHALIACTSHGASSVGPAPLPSRVAASSASTRPSDSPAAWRTTSSRSARSNRSAVVGTVRVMSNTSPRLTTTTLGPACAPSRRHTRPTSSASSRSVGRQAETGSVFMAVFRRLADQWE
ncbi:hypothetical protein FEP80_00153 [Burkholderia multivorans]|nr:hypothetical protein [Burkholderia multivorans]